jgi:hypothetical protein
MGKDSGGRVQPSEAGEAGEAVVAGLLVQCMDEDVRVQKKTIGLGHAFSSWMPIFLSS